MDSPIQATQSDHDILLGLAKTVELQHIETMGKIADIKNDVQKISDGTAAQLSNHELRIQVLERSKDQLADLRITDIAVANNEEIKKLKNYWKIVTGLIIAMAGLIAWLLSSLAHFTQIINR